MFQRHFLLPCLDGEPYAQLRTSFVPFAGIEVHLQPQNPAPHIPTRATSTPALVANPPDTSTFFPIPHHPPQNSAPNLLPWRQLAASPLSHTRLSHANPALNFVTPPPPAARRTTPLLTRSAHPCYALSNKGPTCHPPFRPTPAAIRGGRTRYRVPRHPPASPRRTPILSPNVPKMARFDTPPSTKGDSPPATKSAQLCILEHFPLKLPAPAAVYAVSPLVNSVANEGPELIARIK